MVDSTAQIPNPSLTAADSAKQFDLGISLALHAWPALTLAVQSSWGGPDSTDKRDWFCGAISELFQDRPETDAYDVEDVLVQVMNDEFDVAVDDESAGAVADRICKIREECEHGDFATVQAMWDEFQQKKDQKNVFQKIDTNDDDQETDGDDDESEDGDVNMDEAPALVRAPREKIEPQVDDDGFTKVVGKKKR